MQTVELTETDDLDRPIALTAKLLSDRVTSEQTARVRIEIANDVDHTLSVETNARKVFGASVSEGESPRLVLRTESPPNRESETCWRWGDDHVSVASAVQIVELAPEESASVELSLYGHPDNSGECFPTGSYRFESQYELENDSEDGKPFTWGFTVGVSNP